MVFPIKSTENGVIDVFQTFTIWNLEVVGSYNWGSVILAPI